MKHVVSLWTGALACIAHAPSVLGNSPEQTEASYIAGRAAMAAEIALTMQPDI